jgi:DNA-binding transcriptional regulator YiaG
MLVMAKKRKRSTSPWIARLKALQERLRLKGPAIADRLGVSIDTYKSWRYGRNIPSGAAQRLIELLESQKS